MLRDGFTIILWPIRGNFHHGLVDQCLAQVKTADQARDRLPLHIQGRVDEVLALRPVSGDTTSKMSLRRDKSSSDFRTRFFQIPLPPLES